MDQKSMTIFCSTSHSSSFDANNRNDSISPDRQGQVDKQQSNEQKPTGRLIMTTVVITCRLVRLSFDPHSFCLLAFPSLACALSLSLSLSSPHNLILCFLLFAICTLAVKPAVALFHPDFVFHLIFSFLPLTTTTDAEFEVNSRSDAITHS